MRQWRLLYDFATIGIRNMAVDEAILEAVSAGTAPPTLRFFAWEPACLSLGYGQKVADVDTQRLAERGWQLVRRPTGGRAILHTDELTYSVAVPGDDPVAAGDIVASYRRISQALAAGLGYLGAAPEADRRIERGQAYGPVCFEVPSHYEITVSERKLIGSAQMRRHGGVLQHGSLPLWGDVARICDGLFYPDADSREAARFQVRARATTLEAALGRIVSWQEAAAALAQGFCEVFALDLLVGTLTASELQRADKLAGEVYGSPAWTWRR